MKSNYDIISINDLIVKATIGVYAWEKQIKQTLKVNINFACDAKRAASSDDIVNAINYAEIAAEITLFIEQSHFQLLETLAEQTAAHLLSQFQLPWLKLSITKSGVIKNAASVSISIERQMTKEGHPVID